MFTSKHQAYCLLLGHYLSPANNKLFLGVESACASLKGERVLMEAALIGATSFTLLLKSSLSAPLRCKQLVSG